MNITTYHKTTKIQLTPTDKYGLQYLILTMVVIVILSLRSQLQVKSDKVVKAFYKTVLNSDKECDRDYY